MRNPKEHPEWDAQWNRLGIHNGIWIRLGLGHESIKNLARIQPEFIQISVRIQTQKASRIESGMCPEWNQNLV